MALDNVITLVSDAVEASYYLAPSEPGLTRDEVMSVMASFGHRPGEVADALDRLVASSRLSLGGSGLVFRSDGVPAYFEQVELVFDGDPRNRQALAYVADLLRETAREKGVRGARYSINFLAARGASLGFPEADIILAAHSLSWTGLATISDGTIAATDRLLKARNADPQQNLPVVARRAEFVRVFAATSEVMAQRPDRIGWRELRVQLHQLDVRFGLAPDEELVLDTITSLFADTGEPVSLDDVLRLLPQHDVRQIVHSRFERAGLVHTRADTRVLPSLLALRRTPDLFAPLFLALDEALRSAKSQWEQKVTRAPLMGPHGLLRIARPDSKQNATLREVRLLLDGLSLAPVLYPANSTDVEIRDDVRHVDTLPKLIENQAEAHEVGVAVRAGSEASYTAFLRAMLSEVERDFHVSEGIDLRAVAHKSSLDLGTVRRFVDRARNEGVLQDPRARNAAAHGAGREYRNAPPQRTPVLVERLARWFMQQGDGQNSSPRASLGSVVGRRSENQDRSAFARVRAANGMQLEVALVCDGIGGMEDGAICASVAVASFLSELATSYASNVHTMLERAIDAANRDVFRMRAGRGGTTLSSIVLVDSNLLACHVGDGRICGLTDEGALAQLSRDDTVKGQLDAMGVEREENVPLHERLVQYVGMGEELQPHIFPIPAAMKSVLITSDGAHRVGMAMLQDLARNASTPQALVARTLSLSEWTGGLDNASVVALQLHSMKEAFAGGSVLEVWSPTSKADFIDARGGTALASDDRAPPPLRSETKSRKRRAAESATRADDGLDEELSFSVGPVRPSQAAEAPEARRTTTERGRKP